MSANSFNTQNDTFRKLLGNGLTYRIPRFQRDYSWGEEEWDDLWQDILETQRPGGEPAHYMGYLVLQSVDDKTFDVIDGQQRLTTLSILILAGLKNLQRLIDEGKDPESTRRRMEQLRQTYIGYLDPVTLVTRPKLTLNRNNNHYYQTYLVELAAQLPKRGFRASEHSLRKAFEWFDGRMKKYLKDTLPPDPGMSIAQLLEGMSDRLFFTVITVTDELNAYKVFETLNARGVRLSATDLLKNYLFSVLDRKHEHEHEIQALEERWEKMVDRLGSESFPDFLRMHWNSRHAFVRQADLFKAIRAQTPTRDKVFALLREMDEDIDVYLALTSPEGSQWPPNWRGYASELHMFSVRQPFSLLMAARRKLVDAEFETVLRACSVISFRYNIICGWQTGDQERVYHGAALGVSNGSLASAVNVLEALRAIYPQDGAFRAAFADKALKTAASRNKKIVRYLLCRLERYASGQDFEFESQTFNLEHILPQRPEDGWEAFNDRDSEAMAYRLGNMALLETGKNRDLGNAAFALKKPVFAASSFQLTRDIAQQHADWTPAEIETRQKRLADLAKTVWRLSQLD